MRLDGWDLRFVAGLNAELVKPFDWALSNCGHLMGVSVEACLGSSHPALAGLIGLGDERAVKRFLRDNGGLSEYLAKFFPEGSRLSAQTGDLGVVIGNKVQAGCVVEGAVAIGKSPSGVFRTSVRNLTKVFRV